MERLCQHKRTATCTVLRAGAKLDVTIDTVPLPPLETERVVFWMGLILQAPPPAIAWQQGITAKGVYVSCKHPGSPSGRMSMPPTSRIEEVDGVPTPDLEAFLRVVKGKASGEAVRVKHRSMQGKVAMSTIKMDLEYFPTAELAISEEGRWERVEHPHKGAGAGAGAPRE